MRDLITKILVSLHLYRPAVDFINRISARRQARLMKRHGLQMLSEVCIALEKSNIHPFLTFGVLLGSFREHGFISHDFDIDLGILAAEANELMHLNLEKAGFKLVKQNYLAANKQVFEETYNYNGIRLDIFYYFEEGNKFFTIIERPHETKDWKEANKTDGFPCDKSLVPKCDFEKHNFLGVDVLVPTDTDGWLRAIYSDSYMTPVKNFKATDFKTQIIHTNYRTYRKIFQ